MFDLNLSHDTIPFWTAVTAISAVGTVIVTSVYTRLTLKLFREQAEPKIILYVSLEKGRPGILSLVVENIGGGVATDITFKFSKPLPPSSFGAANKTKSLSMADGPLVNGIPSLEPGGTRVIPWGHYSGLAAKLSGEMIIVYISYRYGTRKLSGNAIIEVESFRGNDPRTGALISMASALSRIDSTLRSIHFKDEMRERMSLLRKIEKRPDED